MLITESKDNFLIFSWYEYPNRKKSATLSEDKATRRRINALFRAVDGREVTGKALRRLWHYEREGLVVSDGYEYALALSDIICNIINDRYNSLVKTRYCYC